MFEKLKSVFKSKVEIEKQSFNTLQIAISALMVQTAVHDGEFDEVEKDKILELIKNYFKINNAEVSELFSLAIEVNDNSNDIQQFTRLLNENLTEEEKLNIIRMMWEIIIADGHIDDYENSLIRKISGLLYIKDQDIGKMKKELIN